VAPRPRTVQALDSRRTRGIQSYRCRVCHGIHPLQKGQRFLKLSAEKRLQAVLINKYCLAREHSTGSCRSGDRCKTHMHEQVSRKKSVSSNRSLIRSVRDGKIRQLAKRFPLRRSRHFSTATASTSSQLRWLSTRPGRRRLTPLLSSTRAPRQASSSHP